MKLFCIGLGAMVLVLNGRDRRVEARSAVDTSDAEERDTDSNHFIGGIEKIRRIPIPEESESGFEDQNNVEFAFKNGLRKYHRDPEKFKSIFDDNVRPGDDGKFPFIPGVIRRNQTRAESQADDFEKPKDEYPFINGLRRPPRSANEGDTELMSHGMCTKENCISNVLSGGNKNKHFSYYDEEPICGKRYCIDTTVSGGNNNVYVSFSNDRNSGISGSNKNVHFSYYDARPKENGEPTCSKRYCIYSTISGGNNNIYVSFPDDRNNAISGSNNHVYDLFSDDRNNVISGSNNHVYVSFSGDRNYAISGSNKGEPICGERYCIYNIISGSNNNIHVSF